MWLINMARRSRTRLSAASGPRRRRQRSGSAAVAPAVCGPGCGGCRAFAFDPVSTAIFETASSEMSARRPPGSHKLVLLIPNDDDPKQSQWCNHRPRATLLFAASCSKYPAVQQSTCFEGRSAVMIDFFLRQPSRNHPPTPTEYYWLVGGWSGAVASSSRFSIGRSVVSPVLCVSTTSTWLPFQSLCRALPSVTGSERRKPKLKRSFRAVPVSGAAGQLL